MLGLQLLRRARCGHVLHDAARRAAPTADLAVAPRLLGDPLDRVLAVVDLGPAVVMEDDGVLALGLEAAAKVLSHQGVAARANPRRPLFESILVVRRSGYDDGERPVALRQV